MPELERNGAAVPDPEQNALLTDSVGRAMLVVLETLTPAERLAFVLHDLFAVPISPRLRRSWSARRPATRQLASRARRRVETATTIPEADLAVRYRVVSAFLAAARSGDFDALITMLDPDVVLRAQDAMQAFASTELRGARDVASTLAQRARRLRAALVDGSMAAAWAPDGEARRVFHFVIKDGKIAEIEIEIVADPVRLDKLDVALLGV